MKYLAVAYCFTMTTACSVQQPIEIKPDTTHSTVTIYQNNNKGIESIIGNKALASFKTEYANAPENKAFAQSVSGAWNWKSNRTSTEHAKTSALIGCQRNNKKSEDLYPCKVIHINSEWTDSRQQP